MVTSSTERATVALLVADDLTGAADASVPFATAGYRATVLIDSSPAAADSAAASLFATTSAGAASGAEAPASADVGSASAASAPASARGEVRAVSTNSRDVPVAAARRAVRAGVAALSAGGPAPVGGLRFKKIDSTLRGHVAAETVEALAAWHCTRAIVAPAFPELGRTVVEGRVLLNGADMGVSVADLFAREAFTGVMTVSEPALDTGLLQQLAGATAAADDARLALICDSTRPASLDQIVNALWDQRDDTLWVGSAGLARALARRLAADTQASAKLMAAASQEHPALASTSAAASTSTSASASAPARSSARSSSSSGPPARSGGCVFFIGSLHQATVAQCAALEAAGETSVPVSDDGRRRAVQALATGRDVLVRLRNDDPAQLSAMVQAVADAAPAGLVMSGGDSALRVCRAARVSAIRLLGEVDTGVPWGTCVGGAFHDAPVVLKSGGFGQVDTLRQVARFLTGRG